MDKDNQLFQRNRLQEKAEKIAEVTPFLTIEFATGVGKTRAVLRCIANDKSDMRWLIVVPELIQIFNLRAEIEKHGFNHLFNWKIAGIICYASFGKYKGLKLNIWFNEAHRLSELKSDIAQTIDYETIIADSATLPPLVLSRLETLGPFKRFIVPMKKAIELGILPEPTVRIIRIELNSDIKRNKAYYGKKKVLLTDMEYVEWLDDKIEKLTEKLSDAPWVFNRLNGLGLKRKKFLSDTKTEKLKELCSTETRRFICFCGSIEQCNILNEKNSIHSRKSKKTNIEIFKKFNNFEINSILVNKMGREGINLEGIEVGIIVQLGSGVDEGLEFIQTFGRSLRADSPEIYILSAIGTNDDKTLKRALKHVDPKYVVYE